MRMAIVAAVLSAFGSIDAVSAATCTSSAAMCKGSAGAGKPQIISDCETARAECMKSGFFVGPVTGKSWKVEKK